MAYCGVCPVSTKDLMQDSKKFSPLIMSQFDLNKGQASFELGQQYMFWGRSPATVCLEVSMQPQNMHGMKFPPTSAYINGIGHSLQLD